MSRLTQEGYEAIVESNIQTVYNLPYKYSNTHYYLRGNVRKTLLQVLNFLKDKKVIIDKHSYIFFLDNSRLTNEVRKQPYTQGSSNRYMRILCAMGFFTRVVRETLVNDNFHVNMPYRKRDLNFYKLTRYTDKELERIEARARLMREKGVTIGNVSYNMLIINGCYDIAKEVYPNNNPLAPEKKELEFRELDYCLESLIDSQGYANREQLSDNMASIVSDPELDRLLKIFRRQLAEKYFYKRPTKNQREEFNLDSYKFIYTKRSDAVE